MIRGLKKGKQRAEQAGDGCWLRLQWRLVDAGCASQSKWGKGWVCVKG